MKKILLSAALLCGIVTIHAQETTDSSSQPKVQLKLNVNYISRLHYYGRTDSIKSSGVIPSVELWLGSKFYVSAAPVFTNNSISRMNYAGSVVTAGYQKITPKWITSIYALKPFYENDSKLVQQALQAQSGFSLSYRNKIINLTGGADLKYSDQFDYGANAGLDHLFRKEHGNFVFIADPSVYANAGTQHFQRSYYKKTQSPVFLLPADREELVTEQASRFRILSYEISMPLIAARKNWILAVTPAYVIPQNLLEVPGHPELSEKADRFFYASVLLRYTIPFKK